MEYTEYREHDGIGLAKLIRAGEVSASEVLEAAIARAEDVNGKVNAIVRPQYDEARERARGELTGSFAGVPFLLKDLGQEVTGVPSSGGSRALRDVPAQETAEVVRRWVNAGLVVFGRTNTPEFGAKAITEPDIFGPARNPWRLDRTPGGSSGGSAAAVAAGIVPVAGASDGGGSIRIPAACCGIFGLKPGRGLVPSGPAQGEGFHGAALNGVLSRSVRDSAAALDVLVGADPAGPYVPGTPERKFSEEIDRDPGTLRIGFTAESALGAPHEHAVAAMTHAAELLESLGHHVEEVKPPVDLDGLAVDFLRAWSVHLAVTIDQTVRMTNAPQSSFELDTRLLAEVGRSYRAPEYAAVLARWHQYTRRLAEFHNRYDLLLTPALAGPPLRVGELATPKSLHQLGRLAIALRGGSLLRRSGVVDDVARKNMRNVPYTQLANLTGRPAMSVPLYWTPDELPLGVQFVAPLAGEGMLFRLAAQLEKANPWADRFAPV